MEFDGDLVPIIRSYVDFMPYCKFQKEGPFDTFHIPLHGFKIEQFKISVNEKGSIKIEGERPMDATRWSRFRQEYKVDPDVYSMKDVDARFGNGVLTIRLPGKEISDESSDPFVKKSLLLRLKSSKRAILRIAIALAAGLALGVGGYVTLKYFPSTSKFTSTVVN